MLKWLPIVQVGDVYLPRSHDSFYHARRILDAVEDPWNYYQFDPRIHAPEGNWLTWPWAYDWMMAWFARLGMKITAINNPIEILVYLPPVMSIINVALVEAIGRRLGLSISLRIVAVLCFVLMPLTQALYGVGILDHHFIEQIFVFSVLFLGLVCFERSNGLTYPVLLGCVLGCAPAFHNGLFILQMPVLAAASWLADSLCARY